MRLVNYDAEANPEYLEQVIDALLEESPELRGMAVEREAVQRLLNHNPAIHCLIHVEERELIGVVILLVGPLWYAPKRLAARDLLVWVTPLWRGGSTGPRLIKAIEAWAVNNGISDLYLSQSTGIEVERTSQLYERMGYTLSGFISHKRINHVCRT